MAVEVIMPKAGSEMEEGEIVQWFKKRRRRSKRRRCTTRNRNR